MTKCNRILLAAVMGMSLSTAAFAQSSTGGSSSAGSSVSGSQTQTGGSGASGSAATGSGASTPSDASSSTTADPSGSMTAGTERSMQRGAMGGGADAQLAAQMDKLAASPDKAADGLFVLDNAKGNLFEVEFARLAQQKSQDDKIKELAKMIESDHSQANEKLKPIAQKMGLELPTSLTSEKQKMLQVLSALNPQDFDTCYLLDNKMVHAKDITNFADHAKSVKDEDLRKYITATLPKLQQHGQHIQQLASSKGYPTPLGGGSGAMGNMDHSSERSMTGGTDTGSSTPPTGANPTGGVTAGSNGATGNPTAPANNQNPSNR